MLCFYTCILFHESGRLSSAIQVVARAVAFLTKHHREAINLPFERGPRVFDPEERSNGRSKTKTMSPVRAVSAPSGDLFWSRLLRAPQEKGEYWGRLSLVSFFGEAKKVTGPSGHRARRSHTTIVIPSNPSTESQSLPQRRLGANGWSAIVGLQSTSACTNLWWVETHPTTSHEFVVRRARHERRQDSPR
jgi:hypothetical protein